MNLPFKKTTVRSVARACASGIASVTLAMAVTGANAEILWSDSFDYSPVLGNGLDGNEIGHGSQYGGSHSGDIKLRSAKIQHDVTGTQLKLRDHSDALRSGSIRFMNAAANGRFNLASGGMGAAILTAGGFEVSFNWTPSDTTDNDWIALSAGIRATTADVHTEFTDGGTDMGVLLRNNGGAQTRDQLGISDSGRFLPTTSPVRVVMRFAFDSFADGAPVIMNAWVGDWQVVHNRTQTWGANGPSNGEIFITLENRNTADQLIDNLAIATISGPQDLSGKLNREIWFGISGENVSDLTSHPTFMVREAHLIGLSDGFSLPVDFADNYGQRLRGWITAPATGDYTFWISGDDESELWLSTGESKFDRQLIANTPESTLPQQWDKYPSQQSKAVSLVAGQKYFIECLHKEGRHGDHLSVAWQVPGGVGEVISPAFLSAYTGEPDDQDRDELPDSWEIATFGNLDQGAMDNPDGDYAPNWEEYFHGTSPLLVDSNVGYWQIERWYDMPYYSVPELVGDQDFYGPPTTVSKLSKPLADFGVLYAGSRLRGYIQVDETADYQFWISCRSSADLMLSTDETPYRKRRIAFLGADEGTGNGIRSDSNNLWDVYVSQMSEPIRLEAGRKYYLEVVHQNGHVPVAHVQVAWAKTDGVRTLIPSRNMSSFIGQPGDADDDSLPDDWEVAHGLDPADNGFGDIKTQGERGDFDSDGLSNREEYLVGTDPDNSDTDGDGLSDSDELNGHRTNPLISDAPAETVAETLDLGAYVSADHPWNVVDGGLLPNTFRGSIAWNLTVPTSGTWIIQVDSTIRGTVYVNELVHVNVSIDGELIGRYPLRYGASHKGIMRVISPRLSAGSHLLALEIDNLLGRRMVQIDSITLRQPSGADADADGIPDWIESRLAEDDFVTPHATTSRTSPFCLEGRARIPTSLLLNAGNVLVGGDAGHWYANLSMVDGYDTAYTVTFANGQEVHGEVFWWATNILDNEVLTIREGDTVRLGAWMGNGANANTEHPNKKTSQGNGIVSTVTVEGIDHVLGNSRETYNHTFTVAGTYQVSATHVSGATGMITVIVRHAAMPDETTVVQNSVSYWTLQDSQADRGLFFEAGEGLKLGKLEPVNNDSYRFRFYPSEGGHFGVVARLWEGGPILDVAEVSSVTVTDALQNGLSTVFNSPEFEGYYSLTTPMIVLDLPPGGKVVVTIFRAGVTFLDGTMVKEFFAADFTNDITYLEFLMPIGEDGGYCHYIDIYDADGNHIGSR